MSSEGFAGLRFCYGVADEGVTRGGAGSFSSTVDYSNGKVVLKEKCFEIAPVDKELAQTRVWEKKFNLNTK